MPDLVVSNVRGEFAITGRYTQSSHGEAMIKVAGSTPSTRDTITVDGALTLHGTLTLVRVGSSPVAGYPMLTGASPFSIVRSS